MNDLKFAFRQLLRSPGFTTIAAVTLALGIGASSIVFSLIQGVLLTPPPYRDPEQLVLINLQRQDGQRTTRGWPAAQWQEWQKDSKLFDGIAAYNWTFNFIVLDEGSQSIEGMRVTPEYFKVMGLRPALGRPFELADTLGQSSTVVILGHDLWQQRFKSDPEIVGKTVQISRYAGRHTIVGVMPPQVRFLPSPGVAQEPNYNVDAKVDYWIPGAVRDVKSPDWNIVARLRPKANAAQAEAELAAMITRQAQVDRDFDGFIGKLQPLKNQMNQEGNRLLLPMAGAVALVFLIACGNAAGLLLARGLQRQHEYALRAALGAKPFQLCRPILLESLLLAVTGGAAGAVFCALGLDALKFIIGPAIPRMDAVQVGWPMITFCFGAAAIAGVSAGILPAWRSMGFHSLAGLKAGSRTASVGRTERNLLGGVAALQIALTLALLVGASLLIQTVRSLANVRPGYDTENILTMSVTSVGTNSAGFHVDAVERVSHLPGVKAAAFGWGVPLTGNKWNSAYEIDGQPAPTRPQDRMVLPVRSVTPDYFQAMGLKLVEGRGFRASDNRGAQRVAILNETAAKRFFPGQSAVGRNLRFPGNLTNLIQIVGILADTRTDSLTEPAEPEIYSCFWQSGSFSKHMVIRTQAEPLALARTVQSELRAIDPTVSVENIKTMESIRAESVASRTFAMNILVGFALAACVLATIGIYGTLSLVANSRRTEMAIRMSIGAQRGDILRLILGDGLRLATIGVGIGIVVAFVLARGLKTYLFGVAPTDHLTLAAMVVAVMGITLATCWIPARRATLVDPLAALRNE